MSKKLRRLIAIILAIILLVILGANDRQQENERKDVSEEKDLIKERVIKEAPVLQDDQSDLTDFEKVTALREWVFKTVPSPAGIYSLTALSVAGVSSQKDISLEKRLALYDNGEAGSMCGGTAETLREIYELFGYESYTVWMSINMGHELKASHVVTLVKINYRDRSLWSVQDAHLNITFKDNEGKPIDYFTLLSLLKERQHEKIKVYLGSTSNRLLLVQPGHGKYQLEAIQIYPNGNKVVVANLSCEGSLIGFCQRAEKILTYHGYPDNILYLYLFPLQIKGSNTEKASQLLEMAVAESKANE